MTSLPEIITTFFLALTAIGIWGTLYYLRLFIDGMNASWAEISKSIGELHAKIDVLNALVGGEEWDASEVKFRYFSDHKSYPRKRLIVGDNEGQGDE